MSRGRAASAKEGGRSLSWLQGLLCGAAAMMMPAGALLAAALLAPGFLALLLDRQPGRSAGRSMLFCGLAGALPAMRHAWGTGLSVSGTLDVLADPAVLAVAWSAAAAGWLLCELAPPLMRLALDTQARSRAAALRRSRAGLEEDWGIEPLSGVDVPMESTPRTR